MDKGHQLLALEWSGGVVQNIISHTLESAVLLIEPKTADLVLFADS